MATLKLSFKYIESVKIDSENPGCIVIAGDMNNRGHEDAIAQICEQMGDDTFMDYVRNMMS